MANVLAELFGNMANAIREKTGDTGTMKPAEFPEKIRSIESGGGVGTLLPLTVTKNGTYYPIENLEIGKSYSLRNDYTQEELKALYDLAQYKSEDGVYAFMLGTEIGMLGIMYQYGCYGVYISTGYVWMPSAVASQMGAVEGWYFGTDISDLSPTDIPTIPITEGSYSLEVNAFSDLNPLFALEKADGFSSVEVDVPIPDGYIKPSGVLPISTNGIVDVKQYESVEVNVPTNTGSGGDLVMSEGNYTVANMGDMVTINHNLGVVPDVIIIRMTEKIPSSTPVFSFFSYTQFSKRIIPEGSCIRAQAFVSNDGYIAGNDNTLDMTGSEGFVSRANANTFNVGGTYTRHVPNVKYYWVAIGNLK